jgi:WD40 repeat protein
MWLSGHYEIIFNWLPAAVASLRRAGALKLKLERHKGPIFSLKWSKKGDMLLSGSVDKTAIVWNVQTGEVKQQFEFHDGKGLLVADLHETMC